MDQPRMQDFMAADGGKPPSVCVVTYLPSPYQVEFFNAIEASGQVQLSVVYLKGREAKTPIASRWSVGDFLHRAVILDKTHHTSFSAEGMIRAADLVVFNYYQHPLVTRWIRQRADSNKPWCFWGERPGFRGWGLLGRAYRSWRLRHLARGRSAIWGVGRWALDRYREEFGSARQYFNLPYFSNLSRFSVAGQQRKTGRPARRFLYCGALIYRKGVDVLAHAFRQVACEFEGLELAFVGTGELEPSLKRLLGNIGNRVAFRGFQTWDALPEHYGQADVAVAPSRYDGWALVVPEALAAGLPVISTDVTGSAIEFLETGKNGWLVAPGEVEPLASALRLAVSATAEDLENLRTAARLTVSHHQLGDGVERFSKAVAGSLEHIA